MTQAVYEILWVLKLLEEVDFKNLLPAKLWCNNQAAIHIASNLVFHEQTKYMLIDLHFIHEKVQQKINSTRHIKTGEQLRDIFTKILNETWGD